jgi:hypothetical protein
LYVRLSDPRLLKEVGDLTEREFPFCEMINIC